MAAASVVISLELLPIDPEVNMVVVAIVIERELPIVAISRNVAALVIIIDTDSIHIEGTTETDVFAL